MNNTCEYVLTTNLFYLQNAVAELIWFYRKSYNTKYMILVRLH